MKLPAIQPGDFLAVTPLNWDQLINKDDDGENWADPGVLSGGRGCPTHNINNDDSECEKHTQGSGKGTGIGKCTKDGQGKGIGKATDEGKGKGKQKRNGKRKGINKQTPGGDDISRAVDVQLQKEIYEPDSDAEGQLEWVYLEVKALPAVSSCSDDDTGSTELESESDSEHDPDVDMCMEDDLDAPDDIDLDGDVDMETVSDDDEEEDQEKEDEEVVEEED
jgi:hypothetical protein